jgi:hypothetical protein
MDKIKANKFIIENIIVLLGGSILFLPFWSNYHSVFVINGNPEFFYIDDNYIEYLFNVFESSIYHLKYPYLELLNLFILNMLPVSILFQIIFKLFYNNKCVLFTCILCLLSTFYFIYFNRQNVLYGCFVLLFQQLSILIYFSFFKKMVR